MCVFYVPGCSTAVRICSFLCAARQPKLSLPHATYRHHYAEEFPAASAIAAHRQCECGLLRGGEETCSKATLTDRGQSGTSHWILHGDVLCLFTRKALSLSDLLLTFAAFPDLRIYVGGNTVFMRVCVTERVCE